MTTSGTDLCRLIERARREEPGALDRLLDSYRNYLRLLARTGLDASLQGKADPSDLVQDALLKASQRFGQFRGATDAELAGWLRQILARCLADLVRRYRTGAAAPAASSRWTSSWGGRRRPWKGSWRPTATRPARRRSGATWGWCCRTRWRS